MTLNDIGKFVAERIRIYRDIERLKKLDDVLLADIGIRRVEIAARVRGEH